MLRILHLSDLHYGWTKDGKSAHRFVDEQGKPRPETVADVLLRDLSRRGEVPDVVIISGDIGWMGQPRDYEIAAQFVRRIQAAWEDTPFIIAPGNHDVDQAAAGGRQDAFVKFLKEVQDARFNDQYPLFLPTSNRRLLVAIQRIQHTSEDDLFVVAVNSAAYLEEKGTPVGFASNELLAIEDHIQTLRLPPRALRLFVLHHALFPFAEPPWSNTVNPDALQEKPDETIVANSATLQSWLARHSFQVVLHGHKHAMHGRQDTLWRQDDPLGGRRLFVVGAGSAGVEQGGRAHNEPLSFNLLTVTRLAQARWSVDVSVRHILDPLSPPKEAQTYSAEVGESPSKAPLVFHSETMEDSHRAIERACKSKGVLCNFISVVENSAFTIPDTARFRGERVKQEQLDSSFEALHPEYKPTHGWKERSRMEGALRDVSPRAQFKHGPRLFGRPHGTDESPILRAVGKIGRDLDSDAYASLFRPEVDFTATAEKRTPHLMSVQFLLEGGSLDAVATFRKLELSYWWVVNMYEIGKLLQWAAETAKERPKPRRITFFAALAEWKDNPEAPSVTQLDAMGLQKLTRVVVGVCRGKQENVAQLKELLREKRDQTNDNNLDPKGLNELDALLSGHLMDEGKDDEASSLKRLADAISVAAESVRTAMEQENSSATRKAQEALTAAIRHLDDYSRTLKPEASSSL